MSLHQVASVRICCPYWHIVIVDDNSHNSCVVRKLDEVVRAVVGDAVVDVPHEQDWTQDAALKNFRVEDDV